MFISPIQIVSYFRLDNCFLSNFVLEILVIHHVCSTSTKNYEISSVVLWHGTKASQRKKNSIMITLEWHNKSNEEDFPIIMETRSFRAQHFDMIHKDFFFVSSIRLGAWWVSCPLSCRYRLLQNNKFWKQSVKRDGILVPLKFFWDRLFMAKNLKSKISR